MGTILALMPFLRLPFLLKHQFSDFLRTIMTGPGRLDHAGNSYNLDTGRMAVGVTYEIMVTISKDIRKGTSFIDVRVEEGNPPQPSIM